MRLDEVREVYGSGAEGSAWLGEADLARVGWISSSAASRFPFSNSSSSNFDGIHLFSAEDILVTFGLAGRSKR